MEKVNTSRDDTRWWDLPAALILIAALLTATSRLVATHWTDNLSVVRDIVFMATIVGLALGQSKFSSGIAQLFAWLYGLFVIPWQLGMLLGPGILWTERLISIGNRLLITIDDLVNKKPVSDNIFFLTLMSILFWTIGVYAGYNLTRHAHPWRAIIPAGIALVIIHSYDSFFTVRSWFIAGYFFFGLLLIARMNFLVQHKRWRQNRSYLPPYLGVDFVRLALITTGVVVLLAWTAPALAATLPPAKQAWAPIEARWSKIKANMSNAFSSLRASVGLITDSYGDRLQLGRGNALSDSIVMYVTAPPNVPAGVRYYWRARVYDTYQDGEWSSYFPDTRSYTPTNFDINLPQYTDRVTETFTIKTLYPIQDLFIPAQPLWVSRPVDIQLATDPQNNTIDVGVVAANPYLYGGEIYQVKASLSAATISDMRSNSTDYPDWIKSRYLQLPSTVTERTRQLAAEITAGAETPYDKAEAITEYLRDNLVYSEVIDAPPAGQDPVDWVLFDYHKAFCNYYATAEVVMLRSLGIPARLAVGYAAGERLPLEVIQNLRTQPGAGNIPQELGSPGDLYTVRHKDAHAWPEVFFPNMGWVEFEPTASQVAIIRPQDNNPNNNANVSGSAGGSTNPPDASLLQDKLNRGGDTSNPLPNPTKNVSPILISLAVILLIAATGFFTWRVRIQRGSPPLPVQIVDGFTRIGLNAPKYIRRWARYATMSPVARSYLELNRALIRLKESPSPGQTPAERADRLSELLPGAVMTIHNLVLTYEAVAYGPQPVDELSSRLAGREIRNQSYRLLLKRLLARFQEPLKRENILVTRS